VNHVLRGVLLNDSSAADSCYIEAFIQPLYIPSRHVVLSICQRLGGPARLWHRDEPVHEFVDAVLGGGMRFLATGEGPMAFADSQELMTSRMDNKPARIR
jgi:hypothetical protein